MRVPLSWLRDFAPFEGSPTSIAAALDDLGLVVEGTETIGEGLEDVVVARVEEVRPVEGADRIRLAVVDAGSGPLEVVCGAFNFSAGDLVALAPVGAVLPGGFAIGRRKLRGVTSNGMLCSGAELRLSDDHEGILVLGPTPAAPDGPPPGMPLMEALGVELDVVFDVTIEANRPDAASMRGVARDLAARFGLALRAVPPLPAAAGGGAASRTGPPIDDLATVVVEDPDLCPRFVARVLTGITVTDSPAWLARRIALAGMRPVNNVVDASNYVMLELGQPTHPYDLDRLDGAGLVIRRARPGERVTTLDGAERVLGNLGRGPGQETGDCLICDAHRVPVGIAGIMGGASSEISDRTTRVLLEVAYFDPMAVARTSKRVGLRTEASARFERGCDPAALEEAADRIVEILARSAGPDLTVATGTIDVRGEVPGPRRLSVRPDRVNALLGTNLDAPEMAGLLGPLGFDVEAAVDDGAMEITVPTFRPDVREGLEGEADVAEEVARLYGYSRLERRTPSWPHAGHLTRVQRRRRAVKDVLAGLGASEAWTPSILSEADQQGSRIDEPYLEITNPLSESERFLRASMLPGLLRALRFNADRRYPDLDLFEVGATFRPLEAGRPPRQGSAPVDEVQRLGAVFAGPDADAWAAVAAWRVVAEALRLDGWILDQDLAGVPDVGALHPTRSGILRGAAASSDGAAPATIGVVGEIHPAVVANVGLVTASETPRRIGWLDLDLEVLFDDERVPRRPADAEPVSRYPSVDMDLAFVVDDTVPAGALERTLVHALGDLCESVDLFDVYRGPGIGEARRSLAYRLRFSALDRTLGDEEIAEARARCIDAAASAHGAALRH